MQYRSNFITVFPIFIRWLLSNEDKGIERSTQSSERTIFTMKGAWQTLTAQSNHSPSYTMPQANRVCAAGNGERAIGWPVQSTIFFGFPPSRLLSSQWVSLDLYQLFCWCKSFKGWIWAEKGEEDPVSMTATEIHPPQTIPRFSPLPALTFP